LFTRGSFAFSASLLKSIFFLSFLGLENGEDCSTAIGEMDLLFIFPLMGVEDFLEEDPFLSSGYKSL
jgi:hypothetical protein